MNESPKLNIYNVIVTKNLDKLERSIYQEMFEADIWNSASLRSYSYNHEKQSGKEPGTSYSWGVSQ